MESQTHPSVWAALQLRCKTRDSHASPLINPISDADDSASQYSQTPCGGSSLNLSHNSIICRKVINPSSPIRCIRILLFVHYIVQEYCTASNCQRLVYDGEGEKYAYHFL